jgi:CRISPR-associated protein (TIGR03986 family)
MAVFVNPYTFVPHVISPERYPPAGHAAMGTDRFSGVLEVTLTARTPLLVGGFPPGGAPEGIKDLPRRKDGTVMIPGSGLMGAVRSLHEALVGSCLRIVDTDWVPVHRHPATTEETKDLQLAVVRDVDDKGRAKSVAVCDDRMRIPKELLPGVTGNEDGLPQTGDQLRYSSSKRQQGNALRVRTAEHPDWTGPEDLTRIQRMGPVSEDCWVLLVTDTNARPVPKDKKGMKRSPVHFWAGRIGPEAPAYAIPDDTWEDYRKTVEGADDLRRASLIKAGAPEGEEPAWRPGSAEYADVWWPPQEEPRGAQADQSSKERQKIGRRLRARSYLHPGQPIWVKVTGSTVTEIRLSLLWRYPGAGTVGERLGDAKPCTEPDHLCWSCRIFGSADTEGREETDLAVQNSYRGHVRVDDLLAKGQVKSIPWKLAPLASPRPSAGQFYLDNSAVPQNNRIAKKDTRPAVTWGSVADNPEHPRPVRGRKFYWRTETQADPSNPNPVRSRHRGHQSDTLSSTVSLIPAGTVFEGRVTFDNLDAAEYGSLLAALDPRMLRLAGESGWDETVTSVGGGKPFGFGSVTIDVKRVLMQTAGQRYLGETGQDIPDDAETVKAFRAKVPDQDRAQWTALRNAITFGFVDDAKVWYPPGGGDRGSEDYDKSFEFFAHTTGLRLADGYRDLLVLPDAALPADKQALDSAAGEHRQRQREPEARRGR